LRSFIQAMKKTNFRHYKFSDAADAFHRWTHYQWIQPIIVSCPQPLSEVSGDIPDLQGKLVEGPRKLLNLPGNILNVSSPFLDGLGKLPVRSGNVLNHSGKLLNHPGMLPSRPANLPDGPDKFPERPDKLLNGRGKLKNLKIEQKRTFSSDFPLTRSSAILSHGRERGRVRVCLFNALNPQPSTLN
jgi:hypothetical protein